MKRAFGWLLLAVALTALFAWLVDAWSRDALTRGGFDGTHSVGLQ